MFTIGPKSIIFGTEGQQGSYTWTLERGIIRKTKTGLTRRIKSDAVFNYYPANPAPPSSASTPDVGLGSHTDLQCFTLLWQDSVGGLQVLTKEGEWIKVPPRPGTFVCNIGDFLMRLSNDRFKSTVHRVFNHAEVDRYSMPFFFGFNFDEKCGVLPSCSSAENPPKYEPISCGEVGTNFQKEGVKLLC
jgi:isopenicillin N synthase-like dioxygenase